MSVVTVNSTQLTNTYSTPPVLSNPFISGGNNIDCVDNVATGASDSANSQYRYFRIPSNARIDDIQCINDANTSGTSYKIGVYTLNGGAVPVTYADQIFASGISMASARTNWTSIYAPAVLNGSSSGANVTKRVWELLGLSADPETWYELVVTAVTPGSAGGNMALHLSYIR
jgi:hypothetical protein